MAEIIVIREYRKCWQLGGMKCLYGKCTGNGEAVLGCRIIIGLKLDSSGLYLLTFFLFDFFLSLIMDKPVLELGV